MIDLNRAIPGVLDPEITGIYTETLNFERKAQLKAAARQAFKEIRMEAQAEQMSNIQYLEENRLK